MPINNTPTIPQRVKRASVAILAFKGKEGLDDRRDDCVDLLADLYHYAKNHGLDMDGMLSTARMHYEAEVSGEE